MFAPTRIFLSDEMQGRWAEGHDLRKKFHILLFLYLKY